MKEGDENVILNLKRLIQTSSFFKILFMVDQPQPWFKRNHGDWFSPDKSHFHQFDRKSPVILDDKAKSLVFKLPHYLYITVFMILMMIIIERSFFKDQICNHLVQPFINMRNFEALMHVFQVCFNFF